MIRFACPGCSATFTVPDDKAGKTSNCPKCKSAFVIPGEAAPPAAIVLDAEPDDDEPRRRPRREDEDDRPRRSRRDDDDRPRSRSRRDDDDDRPRRRDRDYDDDYEPRRRPKKKTTSGMILACGIVAIIAGLAAGALAINDIGEFNKLSNAFNASRQFRDRMPTEVRSALDQFETAVLFLQIATYSAIVAGGVFIAGGIALILHQIFGKITTLIGAGVSGLSILCLIIFVILMNTTSMPGKGGPPSPVAIGGTILRIGILAVPIVFAAITLFNTTHTRFLRYKL